MMNDDPDRIPRMVEQAVATLKQAAVELRRRPRVRDWVDAYNDSEAFGSDVAALFAAARLTRSGGMARPLQRRVSQSES
jgi:hypothetical protein